MSCEYTEIMEAEEMMEYYQSLPLELQKSLVKQFLNRDPVYRSWMRVWMDDENRPKVERDKLRELFDFTK